MLHRNRGASAAVPDKRLGLEDLLGDLHYARRQDDLGRLALLAYCEVRRWARQAGEDSLAQRASGLFTASPHVSREAFLTQIDALVFELEQLDRMYERNASRRLAPAPAPAARLPSWSVSG
jgi:hypothetical protein